MAKEKSNGFQNPSSAAIGALHQVAGSGVVPNIKNLPDMKNAQGLVRHTFSTMATHLNELNAKNPDLKDPITMLLEFSSKHIMDDQDTAGRRLAVAVALELAQYMFPKAATIYEVSGKNGEPLSANSVNLTIMDALKTYSDDELASIAEEANSLTSTKSEKKENMKQNTD